MESLHWKTKVKEKETVFFYNFSPLFQNHVKINDLENPLFKMVVKRGCLKLDYE